MSAVEVYDFTELPEDSGSTAEPSVAAHDVDVLYTAGSTYSTSTNWGSSFGYMLDVQTHLLDPRWKGRERGHGDQSVIWFPAASSFVWSTQVDDVASGQVRVRLFFMPGPPTSLTLRPLHLRGRYLSVLLRADQVGLAGWNYDYPQLCVGNQFLYVTVTAFQGDAQRSVLYRIAAHDILTTTGPLPFNYVVDDGDYGSFGGAQQCDRRFVWARHLADHCIRLYHLDENSGFFVTTDLQLNGWSSDDYISVTPDGMKWIDEHESDRIVGTMLPNGDVVFAWACGRDPKHPEPFIRAYQFSPTEDDTWQVRGKRSLWNPTFALGFPSLTTAQGALGISFGWGGGHTYYASHGIGILETPLSPSSSVDLLTAASSTIGAERWGDFVHVRPGFDDRGAPNRFVAGGFSMHRNRWDAVSGRCHYVQFGVPLP
jgi:hypothetical protein